MCCSAHWTLTANIDGSLWSTLLVFRLQPVICLKAFSVACLLVSCFTFGPWLLSEHWSCMMTEGSAGRLLSHSILGSFASPHLPHPTPPLLCKKWRRLMAFPEWVGGACGKVPLVQLKTLLECTHTSRASLFFCYLLDYSWLRMTESSVYELNLLYVLESLIITVVRIQAFMTFPLLHSAHTHRTSSWYFEDWI